MTTPTTELTFSERRVAGLAAAGHTNRSIARKLSITTSTVEQHLTRVYRKTGTDRAGLRKMVATTGGVG